MQTQPSLVRNKKKTKKSAVVSAVSACAVAAPPENPLQKMRRELQEEHAKMQQDKALRQEKEREHQRLRDTIEQLQERIAQEQDEKTHLRGVAHNLRSRVETVRSVCDVLDKQHSDYLRFTNTRRADTEMRRPEMLAPEGLLTFSRMEGEVLHTGGRGGRSSKRTAFCTDYRNIRYLGEREDDAKEKLKRRVKAIVDERAASALPQIGTSPSPFPTGERQPSATTTIGHAQLAAHEAEYRGLSSYGYHGADSRIDLEAFHKRSSRRTRMYFDYEGKMIKMDPSDWPQSHKHS